jgi:DNA-binding response OmpR family regulator
LAGALGTFGLLESAQLAQKIDSVLDSGHDLDIDELEQLQTLIAALQQGFTQSLLEGNTDINAQSIAPSTDSQLTGSQLTGSQLTGSQLTPDDARPLLLVVDGDRALAESVVQETANWGLRGAIANNLLEAREILHQQRPQVVLLDLDLSPNSEDSFSLLAELNQHLPEIPVVVFTAHNSLAERLAVARKGARIFLNKPLPISEVLDTITQVLHQTDQFDTKILAVDDDPTILSMLKALLEPWGLQVTMLNDPQKFWETLEECTPDLLILDIEMPHISGIELCQIVRNDARWNDLPILFLTAHTASKVVTEVFAAGADDFVCKPIVGPELIARMFNRLERINLLKRMAEIDPLTGIANRHKSTQALEEFLRSQI